MQLSELAEILLIEATVKVTELNDNNNKNNKWIKE